MINMEKIIGYSMMISGFAVLTLYPFFVARSLQDMAFFLVGAASVMVMGFGILKLNKQEEKNDIRRKNK